MLRFVLALALPLPAVAGPCLDANANGACDISLAPVEALYAQGDSLTLEVNGAAPGDQVYILVTTRGEGRACDPSRRVCVDLEQPIVLQALVSDSASQATMTLPIPASVRDGTVIRVQAAWLGGPLGEVSEVQEVLVNSQPTRFVFQTDNAYQQGFQFETLAEANALCQAEADAASLPGTYRAWLSDTNGSPSTTFTRNGGAWVRTDGSVVAAGWNDLLGGPRAALQWGVSGPVNGTTLWTGTAIDGTAHPDNCNGWTNGSPNRDGMAGSSIAVRRDTWTEARPRRCSDRAAFLACFQQ